jgi:hypothetical protein
MGAGKKDSNKYMHLKTSCKRGCKAGSSWENTLIKIKLNFLLTKRLKAVLEYKAALITVKQI